MSSVGLKDLFFQVERYVAPLIGESPVGGLSKEESRVLALQSIHRLNQHIGRAARTEGDPSGNWRLLQTYVNNLTSALKNENPHLARSSIGSVRSLVRELSEHP